MTELPKRKLGRTGLEVTMLGYGAMELRGAPRARDISEAQAETILNAVLDSGINYIDTSIDYGLSEERIGRYIGHRRDEYYLASKCGCLVGAPPAPRGDRSPHVFTPENIIAGVEQSLRRMQTDHLDVVQFHSSPSQRTLQDNGAVDALLKLKDAGKVRFIGMSGTFPRTKQSRATALDPAAVRRHMNPAAGPARTSALVATTSCCCPDWRDLDGKAKVLDAADEAKDLLAFRTAVEMVGAEVLVQSAVL